MIERLSIYPETRAERDRWILQRRPERNPVDPWRPYAYFVEQECAADGEVVPIATVLLTNRECPWRCLMCDLWKNTLTETVSLGAIPAQIEFALAKLPPARQIKLYSSGSFFDPHAIPLADYSTIARQFEPFERVIVESHPAFIGDSCFRFKDMLAGKLEVAMGLETAHPEALERLNKGMTIEQFAAAAKKLRERDIDLRVFILAKPPFMDEETSLFWARRSLDLAFECGATAATLIPTRAGNGALDALTATAEFGPPQLSTVESALEYGLSLRQGRVFVDLWNEGSTAECPTCRSARLGRLRDMNLSQQYLAQVLCSECGAMN